VILVLIFFKLTHVAWRLCSNLTTNKIEEIEKGAFPPNLSVLCVGM
jgi:hypothetical protein